METTVHVAHFVLTTGAVRAYVVSGSSSFSDNTFVFSLSLSLQLVIMAGADDQVFDATIAQQVAEYAAASVHLRRPNYRRFLPRPHRYLSRPLQLICHLLLCTPFLDRCPRTNIEPGRNPQLFKILHLPSSPRSSGIRAFRHLECWDLLRNRLSRRFHSIWDSRTCCASVTSRKQSSKPSKFEASQNASCSLHWMTLWMDSATHAERPWAPTPLRA